MFFGGILNVNRVVVGYILAHSYCELLCIRFKEGLGLGGGLLHKRVDLSLSLYHPGRDW